MLAGVLASVLDCPFVDALDCSLAAFDPLDEVPDGMIDWVELSVESVDRGELARDAAELDVELGVLEVSDNPDELPQSAVMSSITPAQLPGLAVRLFACLSPLTVCCCHIWSAINHE